MRPEGLYALAAYSRSIEPMSQEQAQEAQLAQERTDMGLSRKADVKSNNHEGDSK